MLDTTAVASDLESRLANSTVGAPVTGGHLLVLSSVLDIGFQNGVLSDTNVDIATVAGTLDIPFQGGNNYNMPEIIGSSCADYWVAAVSKGTPTHLANVDSVINDAAKIAVPIANNIRALIGSNNSIPPYYNFINAILKEVLTINWTVKESLPITSFVVTVS